MRTTAFCALQIKLNCIDAQVFPLPHSLASESPQQTSTPGQQSQGGAEVSRLQGSNLLKYNLRPASRVDTVEACEEEPLSVAGIQAQLKTGSSIIKASAFVLSA